MSISDRLRTLGRYGVVGLASNGVCYLTFLALLWTRMSPVAANAICYLLGVTISYMGNRRWTFRSANSHMTDMIRFAAAYGIGLVFSVIAMALIVKILPPAIAQIMVVGLTAVILYLCLHMVKFGRAGHDGMMQERA